MIGPEFGILAIILTTFSFHVVFFGIEVILSLIILGLFYWGEKKQDSYLLGEAKKYLGYIIMTYASAHFFLTATTVMTLSFFPTFLILAGRVLFYPLLWVFIMLLLRMAMIGWFWYAWDTFDKKFRYIAGTIYALAGVVWIYFYMVILTFMSNPVSLKSVDLATGAVDVNVAEQMFNPLILPLLLTIVFAASFVTFFALGFVYLVRIKRNSGDVDGHMRLANLYLRYGWYALIGFVPSLLWYVFALKKYSYYKYQNMVSYVFGETANAAELGWMFILTLVAVVALLSISSYIVLKLKGADVTVKILWTGILAGLSAISFEVVFLMNFIAQTPYFVVAPELAKTVSAIVVPPTINDLANQSDVYMVTIFGFIPLLFAFFSILYFVFTGLIFGDRKFEGKIAAEL